MELKKRKQIDLALIRQVIADYMRSEGCSCCRNIEQHEVNRQRLAELLKVPPYEDDSGWDFGKFCTPRKVPR